LFRQIRRKLNSRNGESLAEVLVAVLVIAIGLVLLSTMVLASGRLVDNGGRKMTQVISASNAMESQSGSGATAQLDITSEKTTENATSIIQIKIYKYTGNDSDVTLMSYSR
jgi:Tfp pilus assembly protein PilV